MFASQPHQLMGLSLANAMDDMDLFPLKYCAVEVIGGVLQSKQSDWSTRPAKCHFTFHVETVNFIIIIISTITSLFRLSLRFLICSSVQHFLVRCSCLKCFANRVGLDQGAPISSIGCVSELGAWLLHSRKAREHLSA